jgi:hypothetical protein
MTQYCSPIELRTQIDKTGVTGSGSDAALTVLIEAVSQGIDNFCNRPDGFLAPAVGVARIFSGSGKAWQRIDECAAISLVEVKDSPSDTTYVAWAGTDWIPFSGDVENPDFNRLPYTGIMCDPNGDYSVFTSSVYTGLRGFRPSGEGYSHAVPTVRATSRWGYALTVPPVIKETAIALSSRWMKQGQSAWADTLASPELATLIYRRENADIRWMLESGRFIRPTVG